ncbi:MAG: tetratricopeptide repeat protein [Saprospiraceae bacterium]|uniref:Tetratricopeptide repeat protein n=1 Tax=Candidatus Opimibacter skivensis TaxID=2982028 RepID=A0A9D7XRZ3_9BACT|nr:tetratricopeptide repeat protein [Candidatus Opimibacter skivensis]
MKKSIIYALLFILLGAAIAFIVIRNEKKEEEVLPIKERTGILSSSEEYKATKQKADDLVAKIKSDPENIKPKLELASLYIQEGRITGDHMYYDAAAMKLANAVLKTDSTNFEANVFKGTIYLSEHHFADGLAVAEKIRKLNPNNAFVYGMLVDANVELGKYDDAVANSDKMISIRPDIRSYSRVSYLREIFGDYPGAIEAMKLAVSAGPQGDEGTEWARVHLGQLYENTGDLQNAEMQYTIASQERPNYAYALAGLGRISRATGYYDEAIKYYQHADSLVNDYSLKDELTDLYALNGQKQKSEASAKQVVDMLMKDAQSGITDQNIGHYADRELAYAYLKTNQPDKALEHAMMEYNRRPDNIDVNETLAWVYYKKDDLNYAKKYIEVAMKTGSKNPTLLCRAGLIYGKSGDAAKGKELITAALDKNPGINEQLKREAQKFVDGK